MEEDKDGHAGGVGGNDDIQFISPSNSPTATNPPQSVSSPLESQVWQEEELMKLIILINANNNNNNDNDEIIIIDNVCYLCSPFI